MRTVAIVRAMRCEVDQQTSCVGESTAWGRAVFSEQRDGCRLSGGGHVGRTSSCGAARLTSDEPKIPLELVMRLPVDSNDEFNRAIVPRRAVALQARQ